MYKEGVSKSCLVLGRPCCLDCIPFSDLLRYASGFVKVFVREFQSRTQEISGDESYEEESFYKHLMVAYNMNSVMASYYLGKFYTHQCGAAIDDGRDSGTISGLSDKALFYLKQAAGTGYVPAMRDYATVNSLCYGFDADTAKYCSFLQIFGETDHAQDLLSRKEELDKDKLFID